MNDFGFSAAILTGWKTFCEMSRKTGRSISQVRATHKGDAIVVANSQDKAHVMRLLQDQGKERDVAVWIIDPARSPINLRGTLPTGVVHFDHRFVEEFWKSRILNAEQELVRAHDAMSKLYLKDSDRDRVVGTFGIDLGRD